MYESSEKEPMVNADEELIKRALEDDWGAFKDLVKKYEGKVAGIVQSMLGKTVEAEDVGQEVFIRFFQSLQKFRGESSVGTYLGSIAINLSLNELKKRKRQISFFEHQEEAGHRVAAAADQHDLRELLDMELKQLEPEFRSIVVLRLMEGYSVEETSVMLKIPQGTVLSRLARAQQKLRKKLERQLK